MKKGFLITIFLLVSASWVSAKVTAVCEGAWKARIVLDPASAAGGGPLLFEAEGQGGTAREMFFPGDDVPLDLPDGSYRYRVSVSGRTVESGSFDVLSPFTVTLVSALPDRAVFRVLARSPVFVEGYLLQGGNVADYKRFVAGGADTVTIEGLEPGTDYAAKFASEGYYRTLEFSTPRRNAALGRPVTGTFTRLPESRYADDSTPALVRANDGSFAWLSGSAVSGETTGADQYFVVNLIRPAALREIRVYWSGNAYPERYEFIWSGDGTNWQSLDRTRESFTAQIAPDNSPLEADDFFTNVTARYAGVLIKKNGRILSRQAGRSTAQIMEFEAYE